MGPLVDGGVLMQSQLYFLPDWSTTPPIQQYQTQAWNGWVNPPVVNNIINTGVWYDWMATTTTGTYYPPTGTTAQTIWVQWQDQGGVLPNASSNLPYVAPVYAPPPPPSPEEIARRARQEMVYRSRNRARTLRSKFASRKAEELLLETLNAAQQEEYKKERSFTVHTADGKRTYKITYGTAGNVILLEAKEPVNSKHGYPIRTGAQFCMHVYHPDGHVPHEDNMLAQALLLQSPGGEDEFLAHANVS